MRPGNLYKLTIHAGSIPIINEKNEVSNTRYSVFIEYSIRKLSNKYLKESPLSTNILKKIIRIGSNRKSARKKLIKIHLLFSILKKSLLFPASFIKN